MADKSERIDLAAVAQHFEMHMRAGRAAGGTHERNRLPARDGIPDGDERA